MSAEHYEKLVGAALARLDAAPPPFMEEPLGRIAKRPRGERRLAGESLLSAICLLPLKLDQAVGSK